MFIICNIYDDLAMEYVDESKRTFVGNIGLALILTIRYTGKKERGIQINLHPFLHPQYK